MKIKSTDLNCIEGCDLWTKGEMEVQRINIDGLEGYPCWHVKNQETLPLVSGY